MVLRGEWRKERMRVRVCLWAGFSLSELGRHITLCSFFSHRSLHVGLLNPAPPSLGITCPLPLKLADTFPPACSLRTLSVASEHCTEHSLYAEVSSALQIASWQDLLPQSTTGLCQSFSLPLMWQKLRAPATCPAGQPDAWSPYGLCCLPNLRRQVCCPCDPLKAPFRLPLLSFIANLSKGTFP